MFCHEPNRASVGFIFNEHKPTLEELNFVMDSLNKRGRAKYIAFNDSLYSEMTESHKEALLNGQATDHVDYDYDEIMAMTETDDDELEEIIVRDENNEPIDIVYTDPEDDEPISLTPEEEAKSPFTPKFKPPVTSTPMDSEDELPF